MKTLIVDIDGTISKVGERIKYLEETPKNWDAFYAASFEDKPIFPIINLVWDLYKQGYRIFFFTGRRESCRKDTVEWIQTYFSRGFFYDGLYMRKNNDYRPDTEVKPEMMQDITTYTGDDILILEDRTSVVKKWRELGYTCLQVADGDF